jgi:hypothetical protein
LMLSRGALTSWMCRSEREKRMERISFLVCFFSIGFYPLLGYFFDILCHFYTYFCWTQNFSFIKILDPGGYRNFPIFWPYESESLRSCFSRS